VSGLTEQAAAERAITAVEKLNRAIGVPARLREFGAREEQIPVFAEKALGIKRILRVNPRSVTLEDLKAILMSAL
jgi:alcohol dehydrogenase class IV